jgi:hypothetical protein
MDVISYGVANKAAKTEKDTRDNVLGSGVQGTFPHAKGRIDSLENALQGVVGQANKLIVQDTVNIIKANAKFNATAKTMKYKHQNMIFEDFLDASGIDAGKSSGYTLDATNGLVKASGVGSFTVVTTQELTDAVPEKAVLVVEEYAPSYSDNVIPIMTSNSMNGYSITPTNNYTLFGSTGQPYGAYDNDPATFWTTPYVPSYPVYTQMKFPSAVAISKYAITASPNSASGDDPKSWKFQGSSDGVIWIDLDTQTNQPTFGNGVRKEYLFSNNVPYLYYRLYITAGGIYYTQIARIEMMEQLPQTIQGAYFISCDDGITYEPITPETLFYFTKPKDKKLRLKAVLPANVQLLNYGLTWS